MKDEPLEQLMRRLSQHTNINDAEGVQKMRSLQKEAVTPGMAEKSGVILCPDFRDTEQSLSEDL